jgi:hypothetical protein
MRTVISALALPAPVFIGAARAQMEARSIAARNQPCTLDQVQTPAQAGDDPVRSE